MRRLLKNYTDSLHPRFPLPSPAGYVNQPKSFVITTNIHVKTTATRLKENKVKYAETRKVMFLEDGRSMALLSLLGYANAQRSMSTPHPPLSTICVSLPLYAVPGRY